MDLSPVQQSGQNHRARHSERRKRTRQTEKEVGRKHQGIDKPGILQVPEASGEERKMEETVCEVISSAPTTAAAKGQMRDEVRHCYRMCSTAWLVVGSRRVCLSVCLSNSLKDVTLLQDVFHRLARGGVTAGLSVGPVSYTHLTLPTNAEV